MMKKQRRGISRALVSKCLYNIADIPSNAGHAVQSIRSLQRVISFPHPYGRDHRAFHCP
jgi:hypothetical protein